MNVHFLKRNSLRLLNIDYNRKMPDLYIVAGIRRTWGRNCDVLGVPKNLEYPKNFLEVISNNEIYKGSLDDTRPSAIYQPEDGAMIYKDIYIGYIGKFLYNMQIVYDNNNNSRTAIRKIEDTVADRLLNLKIHKVFTKGWNYEWDYSLSFEENYDKMLRLYI